MNYSNYRLKVAITILGTTILTSATLNKSCKSDCSKNRYFLVGPKYGKFWKASVGYNWFIKSNGSLITFDEKEGKRKRVNYGDIIITEFIFKCNEDTFFLKIGNEIFEKFLILKVDTNVLMLCDYYRSWGKDTIIFTPFKDQETPID